MQPTPPTPRPRWYYPPSFSYTFKTGMAYPGQVAEGAAAEAAAAAGHAASSSAAGVAGGIPPRGPMGYHSYYHQEYPRFRMRRFGFMRRFVWFGIGAGAATLWIRQHERKEQCLEWTRRAASEQAVALPPNISNSQSLQQPQAAPYKYDWASHRPGFHGLRTEPISLPPAAPVEPVAVIPSMTTMTSASVPAAAVETSTSEKADSGVKWGWRSHRERRNQRKERERAATESVPVESASSVQTEVYDREDEMLKMREAVERLWEDRMREAREAQIRANDKAKEFARDKLDKLSATLDKLRESLQLEAEQKAHSDKKLV